MKVVFHDDFYQDYTSDPASAKGRIEAIVEIILLIDMQQRTATYGREGKTP